MTRYDLNTVLESLRRILLELPEENRQDWLRVLSLQTQLLEQLMGTAEAITSDQN